MGRVLSSVGRASPHPVRRAPSLGASGQNRTDLSDKRSVPRKRTDMYAFVVQGPDFGETRPREPGAGRAA
ncbi:hypothetical protein CE91St30_23230 [Raoultibacter timonensis]|uniref:Uncharacterized protein n=1 Tax=Raoultibacter timonensis TaxID=1907662 RepID=A0ABM7WKZ9_9ACTN|nr:hypothetical protein CE91St30_23230 [Raoultibacter timonensis]BDF51593.1 hypothetical protein CE91St31_23230 [Raoultibacter timonensis]